MTIEQQVCSLELAKRLKELGVKQESLFVYIKTKHAKGIYYVTEAIKPLLAMPDTEWYSAFTVAELGEMLPASFDWTGTNVFVEFGKSSIHGDYLINLRECAHPERMTIHIRADTEADARAKMLIYLLENKLI